VQGSVNRAEEQQIAGGIDYQNGKRSVHLQIPVSLVGESKPRRPDRHPLVASRLACALMQDE
jgi:hypothetical protein